MNDISLVGRGSSEEGAGGQMFSVDHLLNDAAKKHGDITCMAAANDVIVLGTSKGWIVIYDFKCELVGQPSDIDLSKGVGRPGEQPIHGIFVDPEGYHCIATMVGNGDDADTFYMHTSWTEPWILNKMKGLLVNAVAWNRQKIRKDSMREVILGTENGQLYELSYDVENRKGKYNLLFELKKFPEAFKDLQMETVRTTAGEKYHVVALTPTRLYHFTGIGVLDTIFASNACEPLFVARTGDIPNSELHFFTKQKQAKHFAWLSGGGICNGRLNIAAGLSDSSPNRGQKFMDSISLLEYSTLIEGAGPTKPSSLGVSEYHFLLLMGNKVKVVNISSERIVKELHFGETSEEASSVLLGLCSDDSAGLFYTYNQNSIYQVSVNDEGRDMWKVYLDLKLYPSALANCRNGLQRDRVYLYQADDAFSSKDFVRAASFYAKINCMSMSSFEEIILKFISVGEQDCLICFLSVKLKDFDRDEQPQITGIARWATELYLSKIHRLLIIDDTSTAGHSLEYQRTVDDFHNFLERHKDDLDKATTMKLLKSYGRVDELAFFANLKQQYEIAIHYYIQDKTEKR